MKKGRKNYFEIIIISLFILLAPLSSRGQDYWGKFGQVTISDFNQENQFNNADAVVLFDLGESYFGDTESSYEIIYTRITRIKISSKSGIKWGDMDIPYYHDGYGKTQLVENIEGNTYNISGGIIEKIPIDPKEIFDEKVNDRWSQKKVAMPKVKEGSIVELKYQLRTPVGFGLPDWEFQRRIPTLYSEYIVKMIPFYEYTFLLQGSNHFDRQTSKPATNLPRRFDGIEYNDMVNTFAMKDIPAFDGESFITSIDDYIIKLHFQLAKVNFPGGGTTEYRTTWEKLNNDYLKHEQFGKYINKAGKVADQLLANENLSSLTPKEKFKRIVRIVKNNFRWNEYYGQYTGDNPKKVLETKSGSSAEINLLLLAALQKEGLDSKPVILSTRDHGKILVDYPFNYFFNYVIVLTKIDNNYYYSDATETMTPFDQLPTRCLNEKGLLISKEGPSWVALTVKNPSLEAYDININLSEDVVSGAFNTQFSGYKALNRRKAFGDSKDKISADLRNSGLEDVSSIETHNYSTPELPYSFSFNGDISYEEIGKQIFIKPFAGFPMNKNPLTQDDRKYPLDMEYPFTASFTSRINIPDSLKLVKAYDNFNMSNDLVDIMLSSEMSGKLLTIKGKYQFKKAIYAPVYYQKIKNYFNLIVSYFNKPIVLESAE